MKVIKLLEKIVKHKQAYAHKFPNISVVTDDSEYEIDIENDGIMIDMQTANAMLTIYKALQRPENKTLFAKKIESFEGFMQMQKFCFERTTVKRP